LVITQDGAGFMPMYKGGSEKLLRKKDISL
jgi:hypothetical protein